MTTVPTRLPTKAALFPILNVVSALTQILSFGIPDLLASRANDRKAEPVVSSPAAPPSVTLILSRLQFIVGIVWAGFDYLAPALQGVDFSVSSWELAFNLLLIVHGLIQAMMRYKTTHAVAVKAAAIALLLIAAAAPSAPGRAAPAGTILVLMVPHGAPTA